MEDWQTIRCLAGKGHSQRFIARTVKRSRNAVARALREDLPPDYQRESFVQQALEGFRSEVWKGLGRGLSGIRLLAAVRQSGYGGSAATFYRWLAGVKEDAALGESSCRFETDPGEQAQFDWSPYTLSLGGELVRVLIYAMALGYSRRVHWYPSLSEKQDSVMEAIEEGWRHFGGACRQLLIDNAKSMVLRHRRSDIRWNQRFLALCGHYRIQPIAAAPGHPQTKGKVENPFRALEGRFLTGGEWRDFEHLALELARFEAGWEERVHQTTQIPPSVRFEEERPFLLPLPLQPFLGCLSHLREVNNDGLFSFSGTRYCVPIQFGLKQVRVRTRQGRELLVYNPKGEQIIRHALQPPGSPPQLRPECYEHCRKRRHACLVGLTAQFRQRFGDAVVAEDYLKLLLRRHPNRPEDALGQALALLETVPAGIALLALSDAVEYNLPDPRSLGAFLSRYLRANPTDDRAARLYVAPAPPTAMIAPRDSAMIAPRDSTFSPLPALDVERNLDGFAHLLPREGQI